jgi:hypothetical protein
MDFLVKNIASDALMNVGVMHGDQQFLDYMKPRASDCLWGSALFMIDGDQEQPPAET